jgi:hypothetical protein
MWHHGPPAKRASRLIDAIYGGEVTTQGVLKCWVESAESLPPRLREYVFERIEPGVGLSGVRYLRSLMAVPA